MPTLTMRARGRLGSFVQHATATKLVIRVQNAFDEPATVSISPDDLETYYTTEVQNRRGSRTLAGHSSDWREIDRLASVALQWFRSVNRTAVRSLGRVRAKAQS